MIRDGDKRIQKVGTAFVLSERDAAIIAEEIKLRRAGAPKGSRNGRSRLHKTP
jgi:hypothetical protein